jgi:hypothetical protein
VTSALLFVALLVVVDLSYRRWMRRSRARRHIERRDDSVRVDAVQADREIVLDAPDASVLRMRGRRETPPEPHRRS